MDRYNFNDDTMEAAENGTWVAFEDVKHLLEQRTLRDWFAGQALAGYTAVEEGWDVPPAELARCSYALADAMLAERAK